MDTACPLLQEYKHKTDKKEALLQVLRIYVVGSKLLGRIKNMYVDS